jgi:tetratricopeptide (TPR) repeat protein
MFIVAGIGATVLSANAQPSRFAATAPSTAPSAVDIARAKQIIEQLDDDDVAVRQRASLQLNSLDGKCFPMVEAASRRPDISPESKERLEKALIYLRPRFRTQPAQELRAAWVKSSLHEAYENSGHKNPVYDDKAHHGIDLMIPLGADPLHGSRSIREQAMRALGDAINAGCDDPFIKSLYGMCVGRLAGGAASFGLGGGLDGAQAEVQRGDYPLFAKIYVSLGYLYTAEHPSPQDCAVPGALLEKLATQPGVPDGEVAVLAWTYYLALNRSGDVWRNFETFLVRYEKFASPVEFRVNKAGYLNNLANVYWNLRSRPGQDFAESARLAEAESAQLAEEAWKLDPTDVRGPRVMIILKIKQGGDREEMETWFRRAVEANPDEPDVYRRKLIYLSPERHGTHEDMLAFGRECLKSENWRAGTPMILVQVQRQLADESADGSEYLHRPDVWADIRDVYEGGLLSFPEDTRRRSEYAKLATQCGRWDVAHKQFDILGDKPDMDVFISKASYEYLCRKAKRLGGKVPAPVNSKPVD